MIGIANYDSDEEEPAPVAAAAPAGAAANGKAKQAAAKAPAAAAKPAAPPAAKATPATSSKVNAKKVAEVTKEILSAKSATAVVQTMRRHLESSWELSWAAQAMLQIAKRSTARTRKEWSKDGSVVKLSQSLLAQVTFSDKDSQKLAGQVQHVEKLCLALEGLRRMSFQTAKEQVPALERIVAACNADGWKENVDALSRLYWLAAPLEVKGLEPLPEQLRERSSSLNGPDVALIIQAMKHKNGRNAQLLQKVVSRLQVEGIHAGMSATDLVEISEGLSGLGANDEESIRPLGIEILRRRGELTPDESHRAHSAYQKMGLPLPKVWTKAGSTAKRAGEEILTTTTFVPQDGHAKKRRGNNDVERVSPPRVVRDMKMCSY
eukprot:TRINITY_DN112387_c0_g1_i1.p1 TRINITY_DN112387_c0_g1~~TRINITY_DN112387_c0_g1_i1.p1  ORF type:complete len:378 (-),score=110.20 TRINITY_DN112387_c0_g1_i1:98-1231(-)